MYHSLLLFDIDNTLTKSSLAHREALHFALNKTFGISANIEVINYHGLTDKLIIIEVMKRYGVKENVIFSKMNECIECMVKHFHLINNHYELKAFEGIADVLYECKQRNCLMGIVTGNIEEIAWAKLQKVGLDNYFSFGGFGSDHINRAELVRIAVKRATDKYSIDIGATPFLFGDTPLDIKAGKEAGVITVGVASGYFDATQLNKYEPDFIINSLGEVDRVLAIIFGKPSVDSVL